MAIYIQCAELYILGYVKEVNNLPPLNLEEGHRKASAIFIIN